MTASRTWLLALTLAGPLSLSAADYVIGGTVVDSRSQAALARVHVYLAAESPRNDQREQFTKPDGQFSFVVSQAGKYSLRVVKPGYPVQFYRQASFAGVSSAIVAGDDQDTSHIVFQANRGGVISGQVKDEDSEPVDNALVTVFEALLVGGERKVVARGQTHANANGEFRFAGVPGGNYYVCAMGRPWFANSLIQMQEAQASMNRAPRIVPDPAQAAVPSEPGDEPAEEPQAVQFKFEYSPDPAFRGTAFQTTFYPHAQTLEEASLVRVDAGGETQVSIALPVAKAVSVKGTINFAGEMSGGNVYLMKKAADQYIVFLQEAVSKEGMFLLNNVPAGAYEIIAGSDSGSGASSWNVRQEVVVGASDMDVALRPAPYGSVSGRVVFEADRPAASTTLFVSLRDERGTLSRSQVDAAGNFSFSRLPAGPYEVTAGSADYVAAYFVSPSGGRLPLTVEITSGEPVHRDVMLTKAASVIEGKAEKAGAPEVGVFVVLMPKDPSRRWAYRVDQTNSDGSYRLGTIPSGDYFLIALNEGADVAYRDAKVAAKLARTAKAVHIEAGDHLDMKLEVVRTAALGLTAP